MLCDYRFYTFKIGRYKYHFVIILYQKQSNLRLIKLLLLFDVFSFSVYGCPVEISFFILLAMGHCFQSITSCSFMILAGLSPP